MKNYKTWIWRILATVLWAFVLFYVSLPALNPTDPAFWKYFLMVAVFFVITLFFGKNRLGNMAAILSSAGGKKDSPFPSSGPRKKLGKGGKIAIGCVLAVAGVILVINIIQSPLFNAGAYHNRIAIEEDGNFTEDVKQVDFSQIPLLDKDSSEKLGDRVMGQMTEWVSQFTVSDLYTQINFKNEITRVTPLEYADWIKYFTNRSEGIKGYIKVNSVTGAADLVKLDKGMRYMPSAMFFENLERKLRFRYPATIFGDANFEIDNEGHPYWIVPTLEYVGVGLRQDVSGVVILDPITGESTKYSVGDVPTWVDQVYPTNLIVDQVDNWGQYINGFWNSMFGQKNVVVTTRGYNYTVMKDDVFMYTGITSVASDQSIIGFILCNLRTKDTVFYEVSGAEEYSAMASAEGQVQQMKYTASFPLLINLNDRPTYLMSLKDNSALVKMYAFVDVVDYQKVVVTDTSKGIEAAAANYLDQFGAGSGSAGKDEPEEPVQTQKKEITIASIRSASIDGTSYYYLTDTEQKKYVVSVKVKQNVIPFWEKGTKVTIGYITQADVTEITAVY